jgi:hypothetical protein
MFETLFVVMMRGANEAKLLGWAPEAPEGTGEPQYEVDSATAHSRLRFLLQEGRAGRSVDDVIPYQVEIVAASNGALKLGRTTEDEFDYGPWAGSLAS